MYFGEVYKPQIKKMLTTITIIFSVLIAVNFMLLKFSCNKTVQRKSIDRPFVVIKKGTITTTQQRSRQLAPTGS